MYVCGITPYDATHLGHAATYVAFDLIHRYLRAMGNTVKFVENVTDVDDPLLERAERDGVDWRQLAQSQIELFRADMVDLHVLPPTDLIGVVESMESIIAAISEIVATGSTYMVDGDMYLDISQVRDFGSISHMSSDQQIQLFSERGGDPQRIGKRNALDPLLWRAQKPGEPSWESPFGAGRPGWHIECQAIALRYLGEREEGSLIDIQGGGNDLIFPHHEMSAGQVRVQRQREFAHVYVHSGMLGLNGEKMSKSLGNLLFVSELIKEGIHPMALKLALLSDHYQSDRMWSDSLLHDSTLLLERLTLAISRTEVAPTDGCIRSISDALSRNLDTPGALRALREWITQTESGSTGGHAGELSRALDSLLGIAI